MPDISEKQQARDVAKRDNLSPDQGFYGHAIGLQPDYARAFYHRAEAYFHKA